MAKPSESTKHAYTYIPPAVQQSMAQQMQRSMPGHLQKYQQAGGYIPASAQKAMTQQMQKNLPSHLQKYVDPYMHQNVFYPHGGSPEPAASANPPSSGDRSSGPAGKPSVFRRNFLRPGNGQGDASSGPPPSDATGGTSSDPYDFIMNPQKPPVQPFFFGGGNMVQRIAVLAGGFLLLIMLFVIGSSFLNGAANAQKDRLLGLAAAENEIARVNDAAKLKITDKELLNLSATVKLSVLSTKQDVLTALANRGEGKVKEKAISVKDPQNDAALTEGENNGRFDETYNKLLQQLLTDYQQKLKEVYDSGSTSEKQLANSANEQTNLLLKKLGSESTQ